MTYKDFDNQFRSERRALSIAFLLLMLLIMSVHAYNNPLEAAQAIEQTTDVFSSIIRGISD